MRSDAPRPSAARRRAPRAAELTLEEHSPLRSILDRKGRPQARRQLASLPFGITDPLLELRWVGHELSRPRTIRCCFGAHEDA